MKKIALKIEVEVLTGMHIGAGNDSVQIGGVDSSVIKDPVSQLPYIPGSSLKGKLRCLLETEGEFTENSDVINTVFGASNDFLRSKKSDKSFLQSPTRLIFRDLFIADTGKWEAGDITTEFKTEIKIDRAKGTAQDGALRSIERVPPTVKFTGEILVRYLDEKELEETKNLLLKGIKLLNSDFLGGSGSRGYGAVKVRLI